MNQYRKLMSDTIILGIGTFASKALVLLLMPLYTACLLPGQFNTAELISQTANLLIPLACLGITDGLFRFALDSRADKPTVLKTGVGVLAAASAGFLLLSPLLLLIDYFIGYVWLIVLYVLAANFHAASAQYVRACDRPRLFAAQGILNTALVIGFNLIFLLRLDMGVYGFVLSVVVSDFIVGLLLLIFAGLYRDLAKGKFDPALMRELLRYSLPMIPTTIFWWITNVSDRYFVTWLCGDSVSGLYAAAYKIPTLLTLVCMVFYEAWQFSAVRDAEEKVQSEFFGRVFGYYSGLMFLVGSGVVLFCRVFVRLLFAPGYAGSWVYIPVLTAAAVFSALTMFMGSVYMVKKKTRLSFLTSMIGALGNVALNFALIPFFGAQGAAVATLLSFLLVFLIRAMTVQKYIKFRVDYIKLSANALLLGGICAVAVAALPLWWVWGAGLAIVMLLVNRRELYDCIVGALGQLRVWRSRRENGGAKKQE
ncbi:MAG TPA: oligosaccharide flippase family protein [Clostridiales bacterium]|jgi:O-antigen/teichoic acid export membrane protein|nr:oligosaccharide flippase family protein [Clostridiales bacterium]